MEVPRFRAAFFFLFSAEKTQSAVGSKALFLAAVYSVEDEAVDEGNKFRSASACEADGLPTWEQSEMAFEVTSYKYMHMHIIVPACTYACMEFVPYLFMWNDFFCVLCYYNSQTISFNYFT